MHDVILPLESWRPDRPWERATNNAGGTEGGITDGQDIVVRVGAQADRHAAARAPLGGPA